ncbi:MAG: hypothetical protein ACE5R7_09200, partial [Nitrosarchaeum sp.]
MLEMLTIKKRSNIALMVITALCLIFQSSAFGSSVDASLDSPFELKIGETAVVNPDLQIKLLTILDDSRCPSDVTCIWEGTVSAEINIIKDEQDRGKYNIPLGLNDNSSHSIDNFLIMLYDVKPYPVSTHKITSSEYVATLFASKIKETLDSPLKQFKSGVLINDTKCKDDLVLVIKSTNSSPACVTPETKTKLLERGWTADDGVTSVKLTISTGTNSGYCIGYCTKDFTITPEKIIYSQNGRDFVSGNWVDLPEKTKVTDFSQAEWNELAGLIDFEKFNSLPSKIGCPGCADAPIEWIEISYGNKMKKIEFENHDEIPEILDLIIALQEIRSPIELSIDSFEEC